MRYGDKLTIGRFLARPYVVHAAAVLTLSAMVFVGGFVAKMFDSSLSWLDVLSCLNLNHWVCGSMATGLGSLLGWATAAGGLGGGGGWRFLIGDTWAARNDRGRNDLLSSVLIGFAVVAGLCIALSWVYNRLEEWAFRQLRMAQHVVLNVNDEGEAHQPQGSVGESIAGGTHAGGRERVIYEHVD